MIKIAVQTGGPEEYLGIDAAYRLIKECGFDGVDANIDHLASYRQISQKEIPQALLGDKVDFELFKPWKDAAEKYGLDNYQAHAPFPSYLYNEPEYNDIIIKMLKNMIRGCDYINCRNLIIHPFFCSYDHQMDPKTEREVNIERYSALIPEAKEYGVTLCLENMFSGRRGKIYASCCSNIDNACSYIDTLNDIAGEKLFGFCLDTGHLLLIGGDIKETMIKLGDRISAFHIHDNDGCDDLHLAPYMGVQDWDRFIEGLRVCGFDKTMSFETFNIWNVVDKELCPSMMRFIAETGRMFVRRAQEA
ncbi:MAG: sugar phosphate isomerase/epimerase [Ruminococcaceae bacterium]|nr:sugar phosphate isomerase/epimerase [Oscillospiraceae bacterium]